MQDKQNKIVYYAHSKLIYNSLREKVERDFLERTFKKVICPNRDMGELGEMDPYLRKVETCDIVVCSEYEKHIGKGVFEEVNLALKLAIEVFCLRRQKRTCKFIFKTVTNVKIVDEQDWKYYYGKIKTKLWRRQWKLNTQKSL